MHRSVRLRKVRQEQEQERQVHRDQHWQGKLMARRVNLWATALRTTVAAVGRWWLLSFANGTNDTLDMVPIHGVLLLDICLLLRFG